MTDPIDDPDFGTFEPTMDASGANPGFGAAFQSAITRGGYNLDFASGPPDPTQNIDPATSLTGSNFIPNWRFIQSSNTHITASQVRDTLSPSGSNFRFTFVSGSAGDAAYIEQYLYIGGDRAGLMADVVNVSFKSTSAFHLALETQYLRVDYSVTGAVQVDEIDGTGAVYALTARGCNGHRNAPTDARWLRVRHIATRASGTGAGTLDVIDGHHWSVHALQYYVPDENDGTTYSPGQINQANGVPYWYADQASAPNGLYAQLGIQAARASTGSLAAGDKADITVTYATPFPDASYTAVVSGQENILSVYDVTYGVRTKAAASCDIRAYNTSGATTHTQTVQVIAVHD